MARNNVCLGNSSCTLRIAQNDGYARTMLAPARANCGSKILRLGCIGLDSGVDHLDLRHDAVLPEVCRTTDPPEGAGISPAVQFYEMKVPNL